MYKQDLELKNLQGLISYKPQTNNNILGIIIYI